MSDLVQRLRAAEYPSDWTGPRTEHEAADAIARLTYERDEWRDADRAECAENAALKAQLAYAASTGDECAIEVESLRSRLADLEAERELIVQRAENAEATLETCDLLRIEAIERHSRYVKAVGELAGMAARIQDAQRYRWLVGQNDPIIWHYLGGMDDDQIDEAIDKWIADDAHLSRKEGQTCDCGLTEDLCSRIDAFLSREQK